MKFLRRVMRFLFSDPRADHDRMWDEQIKIAHDVNHPDCLRAREWCQYSLSMRMAFWLGHEWDGKTDPERHFNWKEVEGE